MDGIVDNFFNFHVLKLSFIPLIDGLAATLELSLLFIPLSIIAGLLLAAICSYSRGMIRVALFTWIDFFRSFPPLVLLIYIYYGLPMLGWEIGAYGAIAWALTLNSSSYFAEIMRAGIESVPDGQWQAARATGMNWMQVFLIVVIPQGVKAVLPDIISNILTNVQFTSLASVVGVNELLHAALMTQGMTYNVTPLIAASFLYLVILWPLVRLIGIFESKAAARARHS